MIEFINGVYLDAIPIYLYISIIISVFCTYQLFHIQVTHRHHNHHFYLLHVHANEASVLPEQKMNLTIPKTKAWIHRKYTQCMNETDESDSNTSRFSKALSRLRGGHYGTICIHLYS